MKLVFFLSRSAILERDSGIDGAGRLSVRPSVCHKPVPREDRSDAHGITWFSPTGSPATPVLTPTLIPSLQRNFLQRLQTRNMASAITEIFDQ